MWVPYFSVNRRLVSSFRVVSEEFCVVMTMPVFIAVLLVADLAGSFGIPLVVDLQLVVSVDLLVNPLAVAI